MAVGDGLRGRKVRQGQDVCILSVGKMLGFARQAAETLAGEGVEATLWDVRVVKPLDEEMLADAAHHPLVITVEDGYREGGAGSMIAERVAALGGGPTHVLGVPVAYLPHGKPDAILAELGLDGDGIATSVRNMLEDRALHV
jgi:1-deoxy-D-xylulose-5-phosphate synthase